MTTLITTPATVATANAALAPANAAVAPVNAAAPVAVPSVHRRALITWLAVYPTITLALALLGPVMAGLPVFVRTLVLTVIVVPTSAYVLIPMLTKANHHLALRLHH
ncbi:hypothetical protein [Nocardia niigatensis]|uniref:hypothetical protein n=1 Tax=Nocardia niigatensis TaxID=209249 RepID=UPI0002E7771E|nr:hypothetical protein [Nocardia niigatensis]